MLCNYKYMISDHIYIGGSLVLFYFKLIRIVSLNSKLFDKSSNLNSNYLDSIQPIFNLASHVNQKVVVKLCPDTHIGTNINV